MFLRQGQLSTNVIGDKSLEYKNNIIKKYTDIKDNYLKENLKNNLFL